MNIEALITTFNRDGYLVVENFFDSALMNQLDVIIK